MTSLLDHIRTLVEAERGLTTALEKSLPLLSHNHHDHHQSSSSVILSCSQQQTDTAPLLPTPRDADEVPTILAVARAYSLRTSAPPMWNPNLPVIGFATPNPLPHQLRGGALGAMQLKMAREEKNRKGQELIDRRENERRRLEEDKKRMETKAEEEKEGGAGAMDADEGSAAGKRTRQENDVDAMNNDPKMHEMAERQRRQQMANAASTDNRKLKRQTTEELKEHQKRINMNLDSSSSSEGSSEEDESD